MFFPAGNSYLFWRALSGYRVWHASLRLWAVNFFLGLCCISAPSKVLWYGNEVTVLYSSSVSKRPVNYVWWNFSFFCFPRIDSRTCSNISPLFYSLSVILFAWGPRCKINFDSISSGIVPIWCVHFYLYEIYIYCEYI